MGWEHNPENIVMILTISSPGFGLDFYWCTNTCSAVFRLRSSLCNIVKFLFAGLGKYKTIRNREKICNHGNRRASQDGARRRLWRGQWHKQENHEGQFRCLLETLSQLVMEERLVCVYFLFILCVFGGLLKYNGEL